MQGYRHCVLTDGGSAAHGLRTGFTYDASEQGPASLHEGAFDTEERQ